LGLSLTFEKIPIYNRGGGIKLVQSSTPSIQIDLNEFKLHLHLKSRTQLTLHFNSPSRRFYLSLIALVVNEMKKLGRITSIPLQEHLDPLVLLNESVGGSAGSSDRENLLQRIYRKWKDALPNLEEAPLFKVLGKRKEEGDGGGGKIYSFTDAEKDGWANLFEYMGSHENVRLKFAVDKIGVSLNETSIIFGDFLNAEAWDQFISSLKNGRKEGSALVKESAAIDYSRPKSYMPKSLADKILATRSSIEEERKLVTVFFADVANYASMSEKLDPEEVHQIVDGCFRIPMDEIHKYEGTITQFTGDGVMALFGAPIAHEDHAQRACRAALDIQRAMEGYGERIRKDYRLDFRLRIGLSSGPVIVGSIGDDLRMDYRAIGDTVDMASGMKGLARPGSVLVSRDTHRLAVDFFHFESFGKIMVKGKEEVQEAYELISPSGVETHFAASVARGLTRFVGRRNSMAALMEVYEKVKEGSGQVVEIVGEAGVGKSRLLLEFRGRIPQGEFGYLEGRCIHFGGAMAYLPILEILRSYFEIKEGEQEFLIKRKMKERVWKFDEKQQSILSPLQDLLSLKVEDEEYVKLEPKQKRERIFEALRDLFMRLSQESILILVIEDLHWVDKTSEEFLDYLIGWLANAKILLILLHRPEYTPQWGSKSYFNRIGLTQLTLKSSIELVQAILEGGEVAPELRDLILDRAGGNPLFMEELTHSLLENGFIQMRDHQYVLAQRPSELQVPETIQGIIAARMDRLEENLKRIMQVASVIGREFAFRILQAISGMREELKVLLLNLQGLEFIYEKRLFPELEYIFKHALIQEVAYNSLLLKRRKEIHERIGKAIEELYPERLEEFYEMLAYHYARGEGLEKASQYLKLSGSKAARNHSLWEAYGYYKEALAVLKRLPETVENKKEKLEVLVLMDSPMMLLGYPEEFLGMLQEGESLSKELRDNRRLAFFHSRVGSYYTHRGNHLLGLKYTEDAFEEARKSEDIELIVPIAWGLCTSYLGSGQFAKIVDIAPGILDLLEKTGREFDLFASPMTPYSSFCTLYIMSMGYVGNFEEGKIFLEKGLRHVAHINDLRALAYIEGGCGSFFWAKGDWKAAIDHYQEAIKYAEETKQLVQLAFCLAWLGGAYSYLGDPETGRRYVEKGLKIQREGGFEWWLSPYFYFLGDICLRLGDLKNAQSYMAEALRLSQKNNEKGMEAYSWIGLGRILGRTETQQIDKAEEYILHGLKIYDELKMKSWHALGYFHFGEFYVNAGQKEKALENLKKAETMFQEMGMDYWLAQTRKVLAEL
jgi:class 3 adenylate cyclase/tetratricopeptide (TPR) repeat protein